MMATCNHIIELYGLFKFKYIYIPILLILGQPIKSKILERAHPPNYGVQEMHMITQFAFCLLPLFLLF